MIKDWKVGFMASGSYENMEPEAVCENLKSIGYDAVEWTQYFADPFTHTDAELRKLAEIPRAYGMEASEIVVQKDLIVLDDEIRRTNINLIKEGIKRYTAAGIHTINLFSGPMPWIKDPVKIGKDITEGKAWDMLFEAFDEIVPLAEDCKMSLAVENVWGMLAHDIYTSRYLIDHYSSPYLGVNCDVSHDLLAGHTDVKWVVSQWKDKIKHVHLKDAVGIQTGGRFLFPLLGEGEVDWIGLCQGLKEAGYNGVLSVEFESFKYVDSIWGGDWSKAAQNSYDNLKILLPEHCC